MTRKVLRELPALLVLLLCWTAGVAQESLYTYGGSGQDSLDSIAVSGDGRIAVLLQQSDAIGPFDYGFGQLVPPKRGNRPLRGEIQQTK